MTEINHKRNGRRYSKRKPRLMRFWYAGKLELYLNKTTAAETKRRNKRLICRRRRNMGRELDRTFADVRTALDVLVEEEGLRRTLAGMAHSCLDTIEKDGLPVPKLTWHAEGVVFIWEIAENRLYLTMTDDNRHPTLLFEDEAGMSYRRDNLFWYWDSALRTFFHRKPIP